MGLSHHDTLVLLGLLVGVGGLVALSPMTRIPYPIFLVLLSVVDYGHSSPSAMVRTTVVATALFAVALALSFRLPKDARMEI